MTANVTRRDFSTAALPRAQRFDYWRETLRTEVGIVAEQDRETSGNFVGRMTTLRAGVLQRQSFVMDGHLVNRDRREVGRRHWQGFWIHHEMGQGTRVELVGGTQVVTKPGDILIMDADVSLNATPAESWGQELWLLPKAALAPFLPKLSGPFAAQLSGQSGVGGLASSYLEVLGRQIEQLEARAVDLVADHLCRLIGIACGAAAQDQPEALRQGRLTAVRRYVDRHLADPNLSPSDTAAALGISLRTLHALFEPSGTSFSRYVQHCRLKECRAALIADPARPVVDIAFAWGFDNLSTFYRQFRGYFGVSPGELREAERNESLSAPASSRPLGAPSL